MRVLLAQRPRGRALDLEHDFVGRDAWRAVEKEMNMIGHDLQCNNGAVQTLRLLRDEFTQIFFNETY